MGEWQDSSRKCHSLSDILNPILGVFDNTDKGFRAESRTTD